MTGHAANTKRACPSCKSSWIHRNARKVYTCQTCNHVFSSREALELKPEEIKHSAGSGQKAGPVTIGKQMMGWTGVKRMAG